MTGDVEREGLAFIGALVCDGGGGRPAVIADRLNWPRERLFGRRYNGSGLIQDRDGWCIIRFSAMVKVRIREIVSAFIPMAVACGFEDTLGFPGGFVRAAQQMGQNVIVEHVAPGDRSPSARAHKERFELTYWQ